MDRLHTALRDYRRSATFLRSDPGEPLSAVVVTCSESHRANALLASLSPLHVVQGLGGLAGLRGEGRIEDGARASVEYAIQKGGVRHVVVCGHAGCRFAPGAGGSQGHVLAQVRLLIEDAALGPRIREGGVGVHALWFDEDEGDIFLFDTKVKRFDLLGDDGVERFLQTLESPPLSPALGARAAPVAAR